MICRLVLIVLLSGPFCLLAQPQGIFADFTTSMGSFTCQLDYTNAPKAVANFIGLATGQRAWLDYSSGKPKTNLFYNGLTFHRVIANFMIQGGSPNGLGNDDPGYSFTDEFTSARFDGPGVLASANSGPDSNGSQFFVTVAPTAWLNNVHTIFGRVTVGQTIVDNISKVVTDSNAKPLTNVVIQTVQIRRVGTQAVAFNITTAGLPVVTNIPLSIARVGANVSITFSNRLHSDNRVFFSSDLASWSWGSLGIETLSSQAQWQGQFGWDTAAPAQFFRMAQIHYPSTRPAPKTISGRIISFEFADGFGTNTTVFGSNGNGTYTWPTQNINSPLPIAYSWKQDPYRGRLLPLAWAYRGSWNLHLNFGTPTNGTFQGSPTGDPYTYTGVFRMN